MDSDSFNPYAAPLAGPETVDPFQQDDTRIRRQFIDCEANVRTIADLLTIGGLIVAIGSAILLAAGGLRLNLVFLVVLSMF